MKIGITGASGFVGKHLIQAINAREGWAAIGFTRSPERPIPGCAEVRDIRTAPDLRDLDAIINLAGASIFTRWSAQAKQRLTASRVQTTEKLVAALAELPASGRPRVLISASGTGVYGDGGHQVLNEQAAPGHGFLANLAHAWEGAARQAEPLGVRVVLARLGVVLGPDGGAFAIMKLPFSLGLGARLGSGQQYMSWIHISDLVALLLHAIEEDSLTGPLNAVGEHPVTNGEFTQALARALHRPAIFVAPTFALKLAMGEASAMLLESQRTVPAKALQTGYRFQYPTAQSALQALAG